MSINHSRLPSFWSGMSFTGKAAWLVTAKMAKDFNDACTMLARLPRKPKPRNIAPKPQKKEFWWEKENNA